MSWFLQDIDRRISCLYRLIMPLALIRLLPYKVTYDASTGHDAAVAKPARFIAWAIYIKI